MISNKAGRLRFRVAMVGLIFFATPLFAQNAPNRKITQSATWRLNPFEYYTPSALFTTLPVSPKVASAPSIPVYPAQIGIQATLPPSMTAPAAIPVAAPSAATTPAASDSGSSYNRQSVVLSVPAGATSPHDNETPLGNTPLTQSPGSTNFGPVTETADAKHFNFWCNSPPSNGKIDELVRTYKNDGGVVIGVSDAESHATVENRLNQIKSKGGQTFLYFEGPADPGFSSDEAERRVRNAQYIGINTNQKDWVSKWKSWGWKAYYRKELLRLKGKVDHFELDNLDQVGLESPKAVLAFLKEHEKWMKANGLTKPRLAYKNGQVEHYQMLARQFHLRSGDARDGLDSNLISGWGITEEDYRSQWPQIRDAAAEAGIKLLGSPNTNKYAANDEFGIGENKKVASNNRRQSGVR